jgi:putative NADPH-quinone reductase
VTARAPPVYSFARSGFDPVLPRGEYTREATLAPGLHQHCEALALADGIVVVHPNWWGSRPPS